ncbi:hypothetical protein V3C33_16420 [Micrococcaceae bacterium Sec5.7]
MLTLHLLQSTLVHVNTLLWQTVLEAPEIHDSIGPTNAEGSHRCSGPTSIAAANSTST